MSCILIAVSSAYSEVWPSAVVNMVFIVIGSGFIVKKATADSAVYPSTVTNVSELAFQTDKQGLTDAA